jgi:tripartite ATP-independent transporter DctM subunit
MTEVQVGITGIAGLLLLIAMRVPIAFAMITVGAIGLSVLIGIGPMTGLLRSLPYEFAANWALSSLPTFLVMGYVAYHAQLTQGLFRAARLWLSALPGGLAIATIFGAAAFSALSGSSIACAAAMGKIAVPEMMKNGYNVRLATGTVAAAGTLGPLIPPSILLILYGIFIQQPIGKLFLAGLAVGLITALGYVITILIWVKLKPSVAPRLTRKATWAERMESLRETLPSVILVVLVFGGLFGGLFTASEAGALGATFAIVIGFVRRSLDWKKLRLALEESLSTTCVILLIAIGANLLVRFLAVSGTDQAISDVVIAVKPTLLQFFVIITVLYMILGMFLEPVGIMLLTIPILYPVLVSLDINLIWFGAILVKFLEIGMLTPPVGLNVFVIKSVVGDLADTWTIFKGVAAFIVADMFVVGSTMIWPDMVLFFVRLME